MERTDRNEAMFARTRAMFDLPEGVIYLDGNSLGPLPRAARARLARATDEWQGKLIGGWNRAGWMAAPERLGDRIGALIGAPQGHVTVGDTLSLKLYQALAAALALAPGRREVLTDTGNFPSDLYMAQGLLDTLGQGHRLRAVEPGEVLDALGEDTAVLMLTQVDYRTGRCHDMAALTRAAHAAGAVALWDLAHSAGAIEVDLAGAGADFAVGCTYKYLNAGPGAPAFIYVAPRHAETAATVLPGWLGHAAPFDFEPSYRPAPGVARMRVGTPAVLQMAVLDAALDVWEGISMADLRAASIRLSERFVAEVEARCPSLELASPRDANARGSQVSFRHAEGHAVIQALIARGVVGDFRAPDLMRFGFAPLYLSVPEVTEAAGHLAEVLETRAWDRPEFRVRARVT